MLGCFPRPLLQAAQQCVVGRAAAAWVQAPLRLPWASAQLFGWQKRTSAAHLSWPMCPPTCQAVFLELGKACPTIKLLYVTPEQLVKGARLKDSLQ